MTNLISGFLLPPANFLFLAFLGLIFIHKRIGKFLVFISLILLYVCSMPYFVDRAMAKLETPYSPIKEGGAAIVVLGGGSYFNAPEYGRNTVSSYALERLRYAALLYRKTGAPILVTGGAPLGNADSEASQMKEVLENDFRVPVKWMEGSSNNTYENAKYSFEILKKQNIRTIYLVTHAWHMPRSMAVFEKVGFKVIPAPMGFTTRYGENALRFLPNADAMLQSHFLFHEIIGMVWYSLKN